MSENTKTTPEQRPLTLMPDDELRGHILEIIAMLKNTGCPDSSKQVKELLYRWENKND